MDWRFLINEQALSAVLPTEYAHFLRPLCGALAVFLEGLPTERQEAIVTAQATFPLTATVEERLAMLARSCPALHKLGQILARDARLSLELRKHLQNLETLPPSVPLESIEEILQEEFGSLDRLGVTLLPPALAEASVAVVIPYQANRPSRGERPREGVFKVLKPQIVERLHQDLERFEGVGAYLDQRCDEFGIPHLDYQETFEQVRNKLQHEVRFDLEQQHLGHARALYRNHPQVLIPALFEHCTPRVTSMERIRGGKVTDPVSASAGERGRLAQLLVEALIACPFFSRAAQTPFHGDPHAGNLFLTTDNRLAILDWSLAGSFGEEERVAFVQILLGALMLDGEQIARVLEGLAQQPVDRPSLEQVVHTWLGQIPQGNFPGFTWLVRLLDEAVQKARLRPGGDLLLFRKTLHTLEGVVADVGGGGNLIDQVLVAEFLRFWVAEWPQRWLTLPTSRAYSTRLSNADVAGFLLRLPLTVTRFWLRQGVTGRMRAEG
jgi:ubiquinone biosynthesis protein